MLYEHPCLCSSYVLVKRCSICQGSRAGKVIIMKLTMKGDYGLRAMLDMAAYYGQGPIESADIARRQYIPEQYLDQILMALRKEGLVKSVRGPKGGHMLAKPPSQISMAQVMQALEGYVPPMECLPNPDFCKLSPGCALRTVWQQIDEMTQHILTTTTIEELAQRHQTGSLETMYYI